MFLVYYGTDEFSAREELDQLRATGGFDINQDIFTGDEADLAQIRVICDTLPFLSERRLVVVLGLPKQKRAASKASDEDDEAAEESSESAEDEVEDAAQPASGMGKQGKKLDARAFVKALLEYAPKIPETATLVVVTMQDPQERKPSATVTALVEGAKKYGQAKQFIISSGAQLERWVAQRAKAAGASITPEAARLLIEAVGENPRALVNEIEKLSVYAGKGASIDAGAVKALTPDLRQSRAFDLTDALARRQHARALALLHEFLADGQQPLYILGMVASQTRSLIQVKALSERGLRAIEIAQTAGMAPYAVEKALPLARQFTLAQLEAAHHAALAVDVAVKNSRLTPEMALDLLMLQFGQTDSAFTGVDGARRSAR
ncbi:MAG TPA: DNA polymerase III subunit delta [Ktedonobacterales bacterium]|nr:DNA polymerase III subunit delta [Ktedonobacterales bacterium]